MHTQHKIDGHKLGRTLAIFSMFMRFMWSVLVAIGAGQSVVDALDKLNFVSTSTKVQPFDLGTAILLIAVSGLFSYAFGHMLALIWNHVRGIKGSKQGSEGQPS
jgi:H+/Cl- antiporter ClcA